MSSDLETYKRRVRSRHRAAFDFFSDVSTTLEEAITTPHTRSSVVSTALDMLVLQCSKAHSSVAILAQHGLMEDTATIARRLLELSVLTVWIGAEDDVKARDKKAGSYLAFMWRQLPRKIKSQFPDDIRGNWAALARRYGRLVPSTRKTWSPNWKALFIEIHQEKLYDKDYSFLSGIAHGRSDHQIIQFSQQPIRVHSDQFVTVLLVYASRYFLAAAGVWNKTTNLIPPDKMQLFETRAVNWSFRSSALAT